MSLFTRRRKEARMFKQERWEAIQNHLELKRKILIDEVNNTEMTDEERSELLARLERKQ